MTRIGNLDPDHEYTDAEEEWVRECLETASSTIRQHVTDPCLFARQLDPLPLGVLAFGVCGLPRGHDGVRHRAGWTGTGEWFA